MKKTAILSVTAFLLLSANIEAQSWSDHLVTSEMTIMTQTVDGIDYTYGDLEIFPDAVTTNGDNSASNFESHSIFSIYSPEEAHLEEQEAGAWLIGKDISGQTILSKRIKVDDHILRVHSLQYEGELSDEILVFTGSIIGNEHEEFDDNGYNQRSFYNNTNVKMVYGTYNLNTDIVKLNYVDQTEGDGWNIASQGMGVRKVEKVGSHTYMAIGQSADIDNNPIHPLIPVNWSTNNFISGAVYPIGIIFTVGNTGSLTENHIELIDMKFKPQTVSDPVDEINGNGTSVYVGGTKIIDDETEVCQYDSLKPWHFCKTLVAVAAYTFDASKVGSTYDINVDNGMYLLTDEFQGHASLMGYAGIMTHVMVDNDDYPDSRNVIIGTYSRELLSGQNNYQSTMMFFDMGIDLSSGSYSLEKERKFRVENMETTVNRILPNAGNDNFDVIFRIFDTQNNFNQINRTSIGILSLPKADIEANTVPFKSIYNDDVIGNSIASIRNVTGLNVLDSQQGDDRFTYLLADGKRTNTLFARAHFDGAFGQEFECYDVESVMGSNPNSVPVNDNYYPEKQPTPKTININANSAGVDYQSWECSDYIYTDEGMARMKNLNNNLPANLDMRILGRNTYKLNLDNENVITYQLFNLSGQKVKSVLKSDLILNVNDLATGIYILNLQTEKNNYSEKLVIQ